LGIAAVAASAAKAQPATAVQLPTFSMFTTGTTVSVPDRGSVHMGGINRASTGRNEFGTPGLGKLPFLGRPFKSTAIGQQYGASNVSVSAYIHDFEAMDEYLLSQPTATRSLSSLNRSRSAIAAMGRTVQPRPPGAGSSWDVAAPSSAPAPMTVAQAQADRQARQNARVEEAARFFARGEKAEAEGKANVARIYYQMAARRATGELQAQVAAKLEAISRAQTGSAVVQHAP
jgi:hypothetical protein